MGDLTAYKVGAHRHVPEIKQASGATSLTMIPALAPMPRGILSSIALRPAGCGRCRTTHGDALEAAYADEPFVHVLPAGQQPRTAATAGSNSAHLQVVADQDSGRLIVTSRPRQPRQGRRRPGAAERQHHARPARDAGPVGGREWRR